MPSWQQQMHFRDRFSVKCWLVSDMSSGMANSIRLYPDFPLHCVDLHAVWLRPAEPYQRLHMYMNDLKNWIFFSSSRFIYGRLWQDCF